MEKSDKNSHIIKTDQSFKQLAHIPEESVWLANFTSPATKSTYSVAVREYFKFHGIGNQNDLRSSSSAHIISWRDAMMKSGASNRTVNSRISALSSLFDHLCEKQLMSINPTHGLIRPKVQQDQVESPVLTKEQARMILDAPGMDTPLGVRDTTILYIYFYTGCRRSEVRSLKAKNLLEDNGYNVIDFKVKGGKKNRVAIHPELHNILQVYLKQAFHIEDDESPLFTSMSNNKNKDEIKPMSPRAFNYLFDKYVLKAGLPKLITPHSARATFITQALESNCDIKDVQNTVKHANIATTQMYDKRAQHHKDSASLVVKF